MGTNSPLGTTLSLEAVEASTPAVDEARPAVNESPAKADPQRDLRMTTADEFLAAAAKEYETGTIDRVLWRQAADQHGRDVSLVIAAYLRARATALQLRHKGAVLAPTEPSEHGAQESATAANRRIDPEPDFEPEPIGLALVVCAAFPRRPYTFQQRAVALVSAVAIAYLVVSLRHSESAAAPAVAAAPGATRPRRRLRSKASKRLS